MSKPPLQILLVFHPRSDSSRALARSIHRALNEDVEVPGLRIPTVFLPEEDDGSPPPQPDLTDAERYAVVLLADSTVAVRQDWCRFVGDLSENCKHAKGRFLPLQLSEHAWPLDDRFRGINFARAWAAKDSTGFSRRRILIELCCFLRGLDETDDKTPAPTRVFLSHTKVDIDTEPKIYETFCKDLTADEPFDAWTDSGDIDTGSPFAEAIENGIKDTSLLCILTDNYASREWCRKEVLLAKEHQRPVVVVNGLRRLEIRSFPYLGNVPVLTWRDDPTPAIDLLIKETLRVLHVRAVLDQLRQNSDSLFVHPPELATVVGRPTDQDVLYPDPPLSVEEGELIAKTGATAVTPMQRWAKKSKLDGKRVAISVSESTDLPRYGFDPLHLDGATLELCRYLLIRGAVLSYGGHLGEPGYTRRLFELVRSHNEEGGLPTFERIVNFRGWPLPRLTDDERATHLQNALVEEVGRPNDVDESLHGDFVPEPDYFPAETSPAHRFAWARGMTAMREKQSIDARARIVIGGTFAPTVKVDEKGVIEKKWYASRIPGILEEILFSVRAKRPVFLIGAFGGVAALVADLLEGVDRKEATWDFQKDAPHAPEMRALYDKRNLEWSDYTDMVTELRDLGHEGVNPTLSAAESQELYRTRNIGRIIALTLKGLESL